MRISTFIIDDEAHAIELLSGYVLKTEGLDLVGTATDPISAIARLTGLNPPKLLLLDVDMPGMSGLELAGIIRRETQVIFITSYREYGAEAFELSAVDYLLKPISYARFFHATQKVIKAFAGTNEDVKEREYFFVKGDIKEKFIKIVTRDIVLVAAATNYIDIHMTGERVTTYLTLREISLELPLKDFCQVHRSYIVHRQYIAAIEKGQIRMTNKQVVPIGGAFQDRFQQWLEPNLLISKRLLDH